MSEPKHETSKASIIADAAVEKARLRNLLLGATLADYFQVVGLRSPRSSWPAAFSTWPSFFSFTFASRVIDPVTVTC
jgi:hypothetical protein